ncbi:MAG TPA: phosphatidate cytidylyltransferase [Bacillota bacterium]|nr:phosphatidate cytidylyltransferase [Bacillota bacterium]
MQLLRQRVLTALIGIPLVILLVYFGGVAYFVALCICSVLAIGEFGRIMEVQQLKFCPLSYVLPLLYLGSLLFLEPVYSIQVIALIVIILFVRQLWRFPEFSFPSLSASIMAVLYVALLFGNLWLLRDGAGLELTTMALLSIWAFDSFAYFTGVHFGKVRPWPLISPKKSVEGTVGGFAGSLVVWLTGGLLWLELPIWQVLILWAGVGLLSVSGDLAESALKRHAGVKDSGALLPGHGGVLDRFDSLLFGGTFIYWFWMVTISK